MHAADRNRQDTQKTEDEEEEAEEDEEAQEEEGLAHTRQAAQKSAATASNEQTPCSTLLEFFTSQNTHVISSDVLKTHTMQFPVTHASQLDLTRLSSTDKHDGIMPALFSIHLWICGLHTYVMQCVFQSVTWLSHAQARILKLHHLQQGFLQHVIVA